MSIIFPYAIAIAFFVSALAQKCVEKGMRSRTKESKFASVSSNICMSLAILSAFLCVLF